MVSLATGAALSAPLMSSLLSGCKPKVSTKDADYLLNFFNEKDFSILRDVVAIILPETDTPSASDIGIHRMIDTMVGTTYRPNEKEGFKKKSDAFMKYIGKENLSDYENILQKLMLTTDESLAEAKSGFLDIKQQTVAYYLLDEDIAKTQLNYLPVPGVYEPCIKLSETNGKAWAI